jgi:thiamine kinase-like enzyme
MVETTDIPPDLGPYLARVDLLAAAAPAIRRLGGLTNLNYLVEADGRRYVVRIPGAATSEYIDRGNERIAAQAAANAGVNAEIVFFDPSDGLMVTRFIDDAMTMTVDRFSDLAAVGRAGRAFRTLHATSAPFANDFQLFPMIDDYKRLLISKDATLPSGYDDVQAQADETRQRLESTVRPLVPSHCDPLCENFLDTGERMYLIDYEYAGNNDPMWDLGDLSVEGGFDARQDAALLEAYFGGLPPAGEVARMVAYKAMCDLLWTLWGVIQHVNGNIAEDFWAYANHRFQRCRSLMASADYRRHLAAIE